MIILKKVRILFLIWFGGGFLYRLYMSIFGGYGYLISRHIVARNKFFIERDSRRLVIGDFRRNVHRLEKGLITVPRKPVFALNYISETVRLFIDYQDYFSEDLRGWSQSVLTEYFDAVITTETRLLKEKFNSVIKESVGISTVEYSSIPHFDISEVDWGNLLLKRRSVRQFTNEIIDDRLLKKLVEEAYKAPSACNRLSYRYQFHSGPMAQTIGSIPGGARSWIGHVSNLGCLIGDLSPYPEIKDRNTIFIDGGLSLMLMLLGLQVRGISSCVINFPDNPAMHERARDLLGLDKNEVVIAMFAFGKVNEQIKVASSGKV